MPVGDDDRRGEVSVPVDRNSVAARHIAPGLRQRGNDVGQLAGPSFEPQIHSGDDMSIEANAAHRHEVAVVDAGGIKTAAAPPDNSVGDIARRQFGETDLGRQHVGRPQGHQRKLRHPIALRRARDEPVQNLINRAIAASHDDGVNRLGQIGGDPSRIAGGARFFDVEGDLPFGQAGAGPGTSGGTNGGGPPSG